jgi:hypothetical protein
MAERKNLTIHTVKLAVSDQPNDVFSSNSASAPIEEEWNVVQSSEWVASLSPSPSSNPSKSSSTCPPSRLKESEMSPTQNKPELSDKDFPPLGLLKGEHKIGSGYWDDKKTSKNESEAIVAMEFVHFILPHRHT